MLEESWTKPNFICLTANLPLALGEEKGGPTKS